VTKIDPWKLHRVLIRVGRLGLFLYLFPAIVIVVLARIDMRSRAVHLVALGWVIFVVVMLIMFHEAKCPRCGKRFYAKGAHFWQMATECLHCGLPKYADVNAAQKSRQS
jgi:hypothetical protein